MTHPPPVEILPLDPFDASASAAAALRWVDRAGPGMSARQRTSRAQNTGFALAVAGVLVGLVVATRTTAVLLATVSTVVYLVTLVHRLWVVRTSLRRGALVRVDDEEARAVPDDLLPTYTVLVPAFREPEVVGGLIAALERLEYPHDRLQVRLLLEEGDDATLAAATAVRTTLPIRILVVPPGSPQTKPRALNFGLLWSSGELVTIYDAEDRPEPLQLRRAAVALARLGDDVACLQARLEFDGGRGNVLARLFTVEYLTWFRCFLPGLAALGGLLPLGGTSNHFRRAALVEAGAWDAYNVTEDADLGVRLQRRGHRVAVLDSVTIEEVNSDTINWIKQRSRWQKGYLQTSLVHLRHPRRLWREVGPRATAHLLLFVAGTPLLAVCNLVFWAMGLIWLLTRAEVVEILFPGPVYYLATASWLIGNVAIAYLGVVTLVEADRPELLGATAWTPWYWLLMSVSSLRATLQLAADPFHWEKTAHGLDGGSHPTEPESRDPDRTRTLKLQPDIPA